MAESTEITELLLAWTEGEESARARLVEVVYPELLRVARRHLRNERPGHSLTPTALVHEAYLKLIDQRRVRWQNRAHFFGITAHIMRRILVDPRALALADLLPSPFLPCAERPAVRAGSSRSRPANALDTTRTPRPARRRPTPRRG